MSDDCIVRTTDLVKTFEGGRIHALRGVNMEVPKESFTTIMGPSGQGKSTLLHMIGALDLPTSGEVVLDGIPLSTAPNLDTIRGSKVGFVFQLHNLLPALTAVENVEVPMMPHRLPRRERRQRAEELLEMVDMSHRKNARVTTLSGGERQRVAIARALANRPAVILADEPTGDVDAQTGELIMKTLHETRKKGGATLILVTHNPDITQGADLRFEMRNGSLHTV
jgi:putative ABC transport system ATP-binding protein